ncbi:MAG: serine/threonine protein kinase [Candidatus Latescibacter sp.]|nr:serine/threonine protein kinase [Candidatus Latescibacter sp.]
MKRRSFFSGGAVVALGMLSPACSSLKSGRKAAAASSPGAPGRIMFLSRGKIGIIHEDGSNLRYLDFKIPGQKSWGYGPLFSDKRRIFLISYEEGKAWEGNVRTNLWIYDLRDESLRELTIKNRPAPFIVPSALLPGDERMVTGPIIDGEQRVMIMNLDGSDQRPVTRAGEGFTYCVTLSPDAKLLAFHSTGKIPYRIIVSDLDGSHKTVIAQHPEHLYFGPAWSPDGTWLLYQDCHLLNDKNEILDPGHDWSDLCIGRPYGPKGPEHRVITNGQSCWFAASYGNPKIPETVSSGSNLPVWSPDGSKVTYIRRMEGARPPWKWSTDRPDKDHFNRDYLPEQSRGGTYICLLDPFSGSITRLTRPEQHSWDCYPAWSPDGKEMAFSRARDGEAPGIWIMDSDGGNQRFLTRGEEDRGARYPRYIP